MMMMMMCVEVCVGVETSVLVDVGGLSVSDNDMSKLCVSVTQPTGDKTPAAVTADGDDDRRIYRCQYTPLIEGLFLSSFE